MCVYSIYVYMYIYKKKQAHKRVKFTAAIAIPKMALHLQGLLLETTMIIPNKKMQKHEEQDVGNKLHYLAMTKQPAMIQQKC